MRSHHLHEEAMNIVRSLDATLDSAAALRHGGFETRN